MIRTGKKFSKPALSRVINGDTSVVAASPAPVKKRLDIILTEIYQSYNRSTLQKFIKNGFVKVDGEEVTKPNALFEDGIHIDLVIPEELKNADVHPTVLYEDPHVLVVDKPVGLLSMVKGGYCPERTLEDYGLLVHRLDRDTSGVMILAKDPATQSMLRRQFQDRTTHKTYYAVLTGAPKHPAAHLDVPIARNRHRPTTFRVDASGKPSQTTYRTLQANGAHALVELEPTTGRTHQLRVHMQYLGHPIVGDRVYGTEPASRLMLHAGALEITLPGGQRYTFTAPLPPEFEEIISMQPPAAQSSAAHTPATQPQSAQTPTNQSHEAPPHVP